MFLDDRERHRGLADMVYTVNLAMHGDQDAFDRFSALIRREL